MNKDTDINNMVMIDKDIIKELFYAAASEYITMHRYIFLKDKMIELGIIHEGYDGTIKHNRFPYD